MEQFGTSKKANLLSFPEHALADQLKSSAACSAVRRERPSQQHPSKTDCYSGLVAVVDGWKHAFLDAYCPSSTLTSLTVSAAAQTLRLFQKQTGYVASWAHIVRAAGSLRAVSLPADMYWMPQASREGPVQIAAGASAGCANVCA